MSGLPDERLVLYVRAECHLCDGARAVVEEVSAETGVPWVEVDVDDVPGAAELYGELVPTITVDGVQQGYWRLDARRIKRALQA